ncbi:hypothetical protein JQ580_32800 [Bradyrhizobium japonicum]|uniref:hypothetical protein n=1 Tax=Bradyrhizobium japonicum TaxID=375 RepID=UPI001BA63348|nr:hypothetical protein [Bradyrhizobium japonicum]MBR0995502.1 hypothetical protein [Bradyrhizobium japonicum]
MAKRLHDETLSFDRSEQFDGYYLDCADDPLSETHAIELARLIAAKTGRTVTIRDEDLKEIVTIPAGNKAH